MIRTLTRAGLAATLILAARPARAETVQLVDGRLIKGKVTGQNEKFVWVRLGKWSVAKFDRRAVRRIYQDGEKVEPIPPPLNPRLRGRTTWPRPYPTIPVKREAEIVKRVGAVLAGEDAAARAKRLAALPEADRALVPPIETLERWLAAPRKYPKAAGRPHRIKLPWQGKNPRAVAVVGVPRGYDPRQQAWPLVIALHGTEDNPDASVSHKKGVLGHGCFLVAPRTLDPRHFWYHPDEWRNLRRLLGHLADHYRIDPRRIVCSGGSGGGMGTWGIVTLHPEVFCAAASSAGMPPISPSAVTRLRHVPFFILHGKKDFIPVEGPRRMHAAMVRHRIEHVYVEHEGGHFPSREQSGRLREWVQKAPPKRDASPRPALLGFIREAAGAKPLPAPRAADGVKPGAAGGTLRSRPARRK